MSSRLKVQCKWNQLQGQNNNTFEKKDETSSPLYVANSHSTHIYIYIQASKPLKRRGGYCLKLSQKLSAHDLPLRHCTQHDGLEMSHDSLL